MPHNYTPEQQILIFWTKVNKNGTIPSHCPELGACWEWLKGKQGDGYGNMRWNDKNCLAHRLAWEFVNGDIPDGLWVLHKCDNPGCVNPNHLFLGTNRDNVTDKVNKNRQAKGANHALRGEGHPLHRLTNAQIIEIRSRYATGNVLQITLAKEFGISKTNICNIINGKRWKSIP